MVARKRGKGGKFVKGSAKKGQKKAVKKLQASASGGLMPLAALHKLNNIEKTVHRIENRLVPKRVKERLARLHGSRASQAAARESEHSLAAKYG
jgi:hypothetical protein